MTSRRYVTYPVAFTLRLTRKDAAALDEQARQQETSRQEIVRRAIRREIEIAAKGAAK